MNLTTIYSCQAFGGFIYICGRQSLVDSLITTDCVVCVVCSQLWKYSVSKSNTAAASKQVFLSTNTHHVYCNFMSLLLGFQWEIFYLLHLQDFSLKRKQFNANRVLILHCFIVNQLFHTLLCLDSIVTCFRYVISDCQIMQYFTQTRKIQNCVAKIMFVLFPYFLKNLITAPQAPLIITTIYGYHLSQENLKVYLLRYSLDCELWVKCFLHFIICSRCNVF